MESGYKWTEKAFNSPFSLLLFSSDSVQIPKGLIRLGHSVESPSLLTRRDPSDSPGALPKCLQLVSTSSPLNTSHPEFLPNTVICSILHTYPSSPIFSLPLIKKLSLNSRPRLRASSLRTLLLALSSHSLFSRHCLSGSVP